MWLDECRDHTSYEFQKLNLGEVVVASLVVYLYSSNFTSVSTLNKVSHSTINLETVSDFLTLATFESV